MAKVQLGKMGALHPANRLAAYLTGRVASSHSKPPQAQSPAPACVGGAEPAGTAPASSTSTGMWTAARLRWRLCFLCQLWICSSSLWGAPGSGPAPGPAQQRLQALHGSSAVFFWEGSSAAVLTSCLQQPEDGAVPGQVHLGGAVLPPSRRPALPPAAHEPAEALRTQPAGPYR